MSCYDWPPDGRPWLTIDESCTYGLRTLPAQVAEKNDPDDVKTDGDDHWVDAFRYGAMSRPSPLTSSHVKSKRHAAGTLGWFKEQWTESPGLLSRRG